MAQKFSRRAVAHVVAEKLLDPKVNRSEVMQSLAAFLVENKLTAEAGMIMNDVADALYELHGSVSVEVSSARPLSAAALNQLQKYLVSMTSAKDISVHQTVNPDLLGGIVARTPNAELDVSVRSKLRQLTAIA